MTDKTAHNKGRYFAFNYLLAVVDHTEMTRKKKKSVSLARSWLKSCYATGPCPPAAVGYLLGALALIAVVEGFGGMTWKTLPTHSRGVTATWRRQGISERSWWGSDERCWACERRRHVSGEGTHLIFCGTLIIRSYEYDRTRAIVLRFQGRALDRAQFKYS